MRWPMILLLATAVAGCAAPQPQPTAWVKAEATDADYRAAIGRCHTQAARLPLTPGLSSSRDRAPDPSQPAVSLQDMANFRRAVEECMRNEGWTRR